MTKYIYSECSQDYWPEIKTIVANSYNDAVEKLQYKYYEILEDDGIILDYNNFDDFREYLNETYSIVLSDLEDIEEL